MRRCLTCCIAAGTVLGIFRNSRVNFSKFRHIVSCASGARLAPRAWLWLFIVLHGRVVRVAGTHQRPGSVGSIGSIGTGQRSIGGR